MYKPPEDYIIKYGLREAGHYWTDYLEQKRITGKVPVLVEEFMVSLYFVECDKYGYPMRVNTDFLAFLENPLIMQAIENTTPSVDHVYKKTLHIERPIILKQFGDFLSRPYVFMWEGRIVEKSEVPVDALDVKRLLRLAQEAVQKREGLVIDEVLKNKLIK